MHRDLLEKIEALIKSEIDGHNAGHPEMPITVQDVLRHLRRTDIKLRPNQVDPVQAGIDYFKKSAPETDIDYVIQEGDTPQSLAKMFGITTKQLFRISDDLFTGEHIRHKIFRPTVIVAPTAFGKSVMIAKIAESVDDRILILQPNKELLEQNFTKFMQLGIGYAGIYSASFDSKQIHDVTYATIGSIYKEGLTFKSMGFTKIIVDECHLYPREAESMIGRFLKDSGITHVLGLTATPFHLQRGTVQMLTNGARQFFKDILHVSQIQDMIELGYWSPLNYEIQDIDLSGLKYSSIKNDYSDPSLSQVYEDNNVRDKIINKLSELRDRRSIVVFVHSVNAARELESVLGRKTSAAIYAGMSDSDRNAAISDFRNGKIRVLFNVNVLSHGFDCPNIDCIITARPTASISLYYQQLGRGVRISPGKNDCLIIDFSGNVKKFGRIENLVFKKDNGTWELYNITTGRQLTGVPMDKVSRPSKIMPIGEYAGMPIGDLPKEYRRKIMETFEWTVDTLWIREEIIATE